MCDCFIFTIFPYSCSNTSKLGFTTCNYKPISILCSTKLLFHRGTLNCSRNPRVTRYDEHGDYDELMFKDKVESRFEFGTSDGESELEKFKKKSKPKNDVDDSTRDKDVSVLGKFVDGMKGEDAVKIEGEDRVDSNLEELDRVRGREGLRRRRQMMKRSSMLAKQVISIQSALNLGFVSQLWVDTSSWVVLIVEVRPNLLSNESERFLLDDVTQVGDVVLVQDEGVMESPFRMAGLETLVGYNVVTPTRRNIGKVRGYTFNANSGSVESLELDSFGISIIPSALVSTYALFVEDVIEVLPDTVVVHEAAASRVQRLSKGFWGSQKVERSIDDVEEYSDLEYHNDKRIRRRSSRRKSHPKMKDFEDDWEPPMDYL